jgi:hypothetical protein
MNGEQPYYRYQNQSVDVIKLRIEIPVGATLKPTTLKQRTRARKAPSPDPP